MSLLHALFRFVVRIFLGLFLGLLFLVFIFSFSDPKIRLNANPAASAILPEIPAPPFSLASLSHARNKRITQQRISRTIFARLFIARNNSSCVLVVYFVVSILIKPLNALSSQQQFRIRLKNFGDFHFDLAPQGLDRFYFVPLASRAHLPWTLPWLSLS